MAFNHETPGGQDLLDSATRDVFLYRLLGAIASGLSLILLAYSLSIAVEQVPHANRMFTDFAVSLPATAKLVLSMPWIPMVMAATALVVGAGATVTVKNQLLTLAWILALLSLATIVAYRHALESGMRIPLGGVGS